MLAVMFMSQMEGTETSGFFLLLFLKHAESFALCLHCRGQPRWANAQTVYINKQRVGQPNPLRVAVHARARRRDQRPDLSEVGSHWGKQTVSQYPESVLFKGGAVCLSHEPLGYLHARCLCM